jgi:hypothetical protein
MSLSHKILNRVNALKYVPQMYWEIYLQGKKEFVLSLILSPLIITSALVFGRSTQKDKETLYP